MLSTRSGKMCKTKLLIARILQSSGRDGYVSNKAYDNIWSAIFCRMKQVLWELQKKKTPSAGMWKMDREGTA